MTEKFRKIVAKPELLAKKLRQAIEKTNPVDYVDEQRKIKNEAGIKDGYASVKDDLEKFALSSAKGAGWLAAGGTQFLLTLTRWITLDNVFLRKLEKKLGEIKVEKNKKGKQKKLQSFAKKYPNLSAHIMWYFMLAAAIGGGKVAVNEGKEAVSSYKEWKIDKEVEENTRGTYAAFLNKMRPVTPFLIADLIAKEGVHIDTTTGLHTPYLDSKGIPTIGFGSTMLKDGTRVTMNTKPITTDEAYELARWHLEDGETYFVLYCYDVASDNININNTNEALGMSSIIYNAYSKLIENKSNRNHQKRFRELRILYDEYGYAVPDSLVKQVFKKYPINEPTSFGKAWLGNENKNSTADKLGGFLAGGRGLYWRRWLEAGLFTGDVTPQMLLDCPSNGMYEFFKVMGEKKSAFFTGDIDDRHVNKKTYEEFRKWLKNPVNEKGESLKHWKKVKDHLPKDVLAFCETGKCELGNREFAQIIKKRENVEVKTYVIGYDEMYKKSLSAFKQGDYKNAASGFENMIKQYPGNALLHNDLAAAYNKLGKYKEAVKEARKVLFDIGDKSQYAAAQYNAGVAYEQLGDLERALANYKLAVVNGNKRVQSDVSRIEKKLKKSKTLAFNQATNNMKQNNKNSDFITFVFDENYLG